MLGASLGMGYPLVSSSKTNQSFSITNSKSIKVGLLWSLSGHLSVIETPSLDVGLFWIDKINKEGGVAGLQVEPVIIDAYSDIKAYRQGIDHLMNKENVVATFGGYTSASRRSVMPLVTLNNSLFYYPTCYEGRECWQNIICTGPIANQHSYDLIPYMVKEYGPRVYFIGSNYVWPKESNFNASFWLKQIGGEKVGESYIPLGHGNFDNAFKEIREIQPDWIFSTVVGESDIYFRKEYLHAGFDPETMPTASLTTSEMEVALMGANYGEGHVLSAPYFQSLDNECNHSFVDEFLSSEYGRSGVTHYNMEETYLTFLYFKKAVENLVLAEGEEAISPGKIREYTAGMKLSAEESPEGPVKIDRNNFNSWLTPKIGKFNSQGQIDLLYQQQHPIAPEPYKLYPHRGECMVDGLHLPNGNIVRAAS
ncbi:MAG: transporter substrate-binding domain-containing protein [Pseudomonadota bacterium]